LYEFNIVCLSITEVINCFAKALVVQLIHEWTGFSPVKSRIWSSGFCRSCHTHEPASFLPVFHRFRQESGPAGPIRSKKSNRPVRSGLKKSDRFQVCIRVHNFEKCWSSCMGSNHIYVEYQIEPMNQHFFSDTWETGCIWIRARTKVFLLVLFVLFQVKVEVQVLFSEYKYKYLYFRKRTCTYTCTSKQILSYLYLSTKTCTLYFYLQYKTMSLEVFGEPFCFFEILTAIWY
jgi:hypothetical protein